MKGNDKRKPKNLLRDWGSERRKGKTIPLKRGVSPPLSSTYTLPQRQENACQMPTSTSCRALGESIKVDTKKALAETRKEAKTGEKSKPEVMYHHSSPSPQHSGRRVR